MSEHSDIDANNLCITEDVFEKFQAESMYEEEELITLSDILPSNGTSASTAADDANDFLTDENVTLNVLQTVNNSPNISSENVQHSEITTGFVEETIEHEELLETSHLNISENIEVHTEEKQPKRRGRKKKKTVQETALVNVSAQEIEQLPPKRRGRRKNGNNDISIEEQMQLIHEDNPHTSKNETIQENLEMENQYMPQIPKRRGRKKKIVQESKIDTSLEDNGGVISKTNEQLDTDIENCQDIGQNNKRRGRKKKTEQNYDTDASLKNSNINSSDDNVEFIENIDMSDDLPISQIKNEELNITHNVNESLHNESIGLPKSRARRGFNTTLTESYVKKNNTPSGKRRGRPKKQAQSQVETEISELKNNIDSQIRNDESKVEEPSSTVDKSGPFLQNPKESSMVNEIGNCDDVDDISLSIIKKGLILHDSDDIPTSSKEDVITSTIEIEFEGVEEVGQEEKITKRNSKTPKLPDFEYNLDNITNENVDKIKDTTLNEGEAEESLLVEDTSKRPKRRKIKQNFHYQEDSDEDPFANIELSDDEPKRGKRGARYYSDDEYIPGKKQGKVESSNSSISSDMDIEDLELQGIKKQKRKRLSKKLDSPRKKGKKTEISATGCVLDVTTVPPVSINNSDDIEVCLESSVIKNPQVDDNTDKVTWGNTNEFENFIAQKIQGTDLKIKKVSSAASSTSIAPLDIPTLDSTKKLVEKSTQTLTTKKNAQGVQTSPPYDIPMKENVALTKEQSEKACEFLNSIVKTTSELGVLMTEKSEDFMKKKIHTDHVTDTFKMDYCVRKSFLLFKLAKHNLVQMEEDLAKQYNEFLINNDLNTCRDSVKTLASTSKQKTDDNDSDCEIVEVKPIAGVSKAKNKSEKSKLNPKTVFLNKELSIKITKKPSEDKKLNIKGRHTVWINDSVILKKVTPNQSFLAQDSRNKKPPDSNIIESIVYNFFRDYKRQQALFVCAPFISTNWMTVKKRYACNYFVGSPEIPTGSEHFVNNSSSESVSDINKTICEAKCDSLASLSSPKSLFSLCTSTIQRHTSLRKCNVKKQPLTLFEICLQTLNKDTKHAMHSEIVNVTNALPLKTICYKKVMDLLRKNKNQNNSTCFISVEEKIDEINQIVPKISNNKNQCSNKIKKGQHLKKLFTLCVQYMQAVIEKSFQNELLIRKEYSGDPQELNTFSNTFSPKACINKCAYANILLSTFNPQSLKKITYKNILHLIYDSLVVKCGDDDTLRSVHKVKTLKTICLDVIKLNMYGLNVTEDMTINSVNTLSEEAFLNIENTCTVEGDQYQYFDDDTNCYEDEFEPEYNLEEEANDNILQDNSWVKQVQMKELKSCLVSSMSNTKGESVNDEPVEPPVNAPPDIPFMVNIKSEPLEEELVENMNDPVNVKIEPVHYNELTMTLEAVTTKTEPDNSNSVINSIQRSASYDGDAFEDFVSSNKMMQAIQNADRSEEIFSQSALRVRRQFDPDSDDENDAGMSLLVPHTYEPLQITEAKETLMQSSSDEGNKDVTSKRKIDRRKRRTKKVEAKANNKEFNNSSKNKEANNVVETKNNKDVNASRNKNVNNEVAVLTRRMREKIRQEEKKVQSSDSENDIRETKSKSDRKKGKVEEIIDNSKKYKKKYDESDIQCNNVDSTEQVNCVGDNAENAKDSIPDEIFTGFSAVDQSTITTYQKYLKNVYDKILPKIDRGNKSVSEDCDPTGKEQFMNPDQPVEYLECEPTLPIFERESRKRSSKRNVKASPNKVVSEEVVPDSIVPDKVIPESQERTSNENNKITEPIQTVDRHGWQCYPIDVNDKKLYENCQIILDKLPEAFVEMYFQYQDITVRNKEDEEVDKLINLQSLNRTSIKEIKSRSIAKDKTEQIEGSTVAGNDLDDTRPESPGSDHYRELTPSEDEGSDREDETLASTVKPASENNMAKSSLMDDKSDTDTENAEGRKKIKEEPVDEATKKNVSSGASKRKPGPNSNTKPDDKLQQKPGVQADLMLTADKVMNKELTLLHAPIKLDDNAPKVSMKKTSGRGKTRNSSKKEIHYRIKNEDDSSSEEEKQWVTTKEKLLKRLEKKQETTIADEAKRTKIVSEYIERRAENTEPRLPQRRRGRRSNKKFLERQKQLRVLTKELLGDAADSTHHTKRYNQAFFKGRRNIRKVIDKKSLARSTVMANMEEFERKRRLTMKQVKLREQLGCEEGVNVLVINDELCLEYDFEQQVPVVAVHPFFTKIMKAHQYEGVKFMWDACFESLSQLAAGHPGGGCILAHCMGLGKTLQVLALLHTVLTHPGVGMQRVLVCCPLSTVLNWVDEIHKWIGPVTDQIKVFELSKLKKTYERAYQLEDWYSGGGIFIIGYELFRSLTTLDPYLDDVRPTIVKKIRTALLDPGPDIIVCDEGHLLKNDCSVLAVAMSRVATRRRVVLTGTPMQNNLREYYCMVNFVKPDLLGTYAEYSNRFENPIMNGQHRDSSEEDIKLMKARTHILHKVLEGCLQRQEASVLYPYLPKKHEYTVFISLTKCQWDMYKYYLTHYASKAKNGVLKDFHILQKVWSHPQVLHHFQTKARDVNVNKVKAEKIEDDLAEEDAATEDIKPNDTDIWWLQFLEGGAMLDSLESSNKFVVVFRILDECIKLGDKVLIFSTSLFTMDALEFFLRKINKWSLGQEYYRLDGSVPPEVRQKWCREFNAEHNHKTKLFLISTRAGSLGLNMTAANRVIILDTSWNPAHDIQSIFRVYRFGQKKDCYIYRLVALGTMEQKIYERSVTKQAVACRVVDEQQIDRHYNMQELTELYRFDESGAGVAGGVACGVRDVALLRVARLRALHAVHEHDSLLRGSEPALPEHERQAAWSQFQQEHESGQLENNEKVKKISAVKRTYNKAASSTAVKADPGDDDSPDFKPKEPRAKRGRKTANVEPEGESILPDPDTDRINTLDPNTEQFMVKKITELLVRHNFSAKDAQSALPQLVMNVRRIVMTGQDIGRCDELTASIAKVLMQRQKNMSMPLVNGIIGESLNQTMPDGERIPTIDTPVETPMPPLVKIPPRPSRPKNKPGPKCRKGYVYEEIPSTSTANVPLFDRLLLPDDYDGRTKRKAALAAEKLLDTAIGDGVIDVDDDDDYNSGTDSAPEAKAEDARANDKAQAVKVTEVTKPDNPKTERKLDNTKKPGPRKSKQKEADSELEILEDVMDTSILLSDDEERILSKTAVELEPEGEVSVHPTLLKNSNFIKIVAHTYLAGNPMLDEDAAMLAARYSTYKAVKELETTGKPITSGPIYDIAVQVLGKPILKKLHNTNHKVDTATDTQSTLLLDLLENMGDSDKSKSLGNDKVDKSVKETKMPNDKEEENAKVKRKRGRGRPRKVLLSDSDDSDTPIISEQPPLEAAPAQKPSFQSQITPQSAQREVTTPAAQPAPAQGVVPVGLFKTTVSVALPGEPQTVRREAEECILPDDDIHIVSDDAPQPVPVTQITPPSMVPLSKLVAKPNPPAPTSRNSQPLLVRMVRSSNSSQILETPSTTQPANTVHFRVTANDTQPMTQTPMLVPATTRAPKPTDTTICLDSDDEDTPIVPINPQPVSIASSSHAPMFQPVAPKPTIAGQPVQLRFSKVDPSKFVLTAKKPQQPTESFKDSNDSSVRYIVIPKNQVGQMYPPLVPLQPEQVPLNHRVRSNSDGTFTLHTANSVTTLPNKTIPENQVTHITNNLSMNVASQYAQDANKPSQRAAQKKGKSTSTPTPCLAIDKGRIVNENESMARPIKVVKSRKTFILRKVSGEKYNSTNVTSNVMSNPVKSTSTAQKEVKTTVPSLSIDSGIILKQGGSTPAKSAVERQTMPDKPAKRQRDVSSSDSDSSQSDVNDDPLSILKDVVHIQAQSYEVETPSNTTNKREDSKKPVSNSASKTKTPSSAKTSSLTNKTPGVANAAPPKPMNQPNKLFDAVDLTYIDDEVVVTSHKTQHTATKSISKATKSQPTPTKPAPTATKSQPTPIKPAPTATKPQLTATKSQFTSAKSTPIATKSQIANKTPQISYKISPTAKQTSMGTSKTNQPTRQSTVSKAQPSTSKTQPAVSKASCSSQAAPKKRAAPVEPAPGKKKKSDQLMTLKDFNIDDIDDIIELD
ncbi:uncharacterized protein LOC106132696 [Amyelois transitella]|uniref:uncharacterized protein LOC106132696 n=1 Tax=Amyelois transitella TaxID=680683 RepID=UPI00298F7706|nr:uncharacterized protein LOC106132696 [Amyelois transitella]